jgi:hypothetical protein
MREVPLWRRKRTERKVHSDKEQRCIRLHKFDYDVVFVKRHLFAFSSARSLVFELPAPHGSFPEADLSVLINEVAEIQRPATRLVIVSRDTINIY